MPSKIRIRKTERFDLQRKIVANMTTESWTTIPHASAVYEPDVTAFLEEWQQCKAQPEWQGISLNTLLMYACAKGFLAAPEMNAHMHFNRKLVTGTITQYDEVNISMPAAMSNGKMMTLNVRNCESKTLRKLSDYIADLYRRMEKTVLDEAMYEVSKENTMNLLKRLKVFTVLARFAGLIPSRHEINRLKGKAKQDYDAMPNTERLTKYDIEQGTILVSNVGSIYRGSTCRLTLLDVIPPMVAAVGLSSFVEQGDRKFLPFNICFDHRALDFDGVVPFMKCLDDVFANPAQMRDWLENCPKEVS